MNSPWWHKLKMSYPQYSALSQLLSVLYIITNPAIFASLNVFEADGKLFAGWSLYFLLRLISGGTDSCICICSAVWFCGLSSVAVSFSQIYLSPDMSGWGAPAHVLIIHFWENEASGLFLWTHDLKVQTVPVIFCLLAAE